MTRSALALLSLSLLAAHAGAQDDAQRPIRFARHPSLSPDGSQLAFAYHGDIWTVPAAGGKASRLTIHEAHEQLPSWSPDGKWIAFSSKREGDYDVWVVSSEGGRPRRLTFHSADDQVSGWSPDGKQILFTSSRETTRTSAVYAVDAATGASRLLARDDIAVGNGCLSHDGQTLAVTRGGSWVRKGYRGSGNSSLMAFPLSGGAGKWLVREPENERNPVYSADGKSLIYVSDKSGVFNLWRKALPDGRTTQLTRHTDGNVFYPTVSRAGDRVVYEHNFGLWSVSPNGGEPTEIRIFAPTDDRSNTVRPETLTTGVQETALSPDGKQLAFIVRGEVFLQPATGGEAQRLSETSQREEGLSWSADGKLLAFSSDRTGTPQLYVTDAKSKETKQLTADPNRSAHSPQFSPDGKSIAFLRGGNGDQLCVVPASGGDERALIRDPAMGSLAWSPDSKWLAVHRVKAHSAGVNSEVFIVRVEDGARTNVSRYPVINTAPSWSADGKRLFFASSRSGETQIWSVSLQDPATVPEDDASAAKPAAGKPVEVKVDLEDLHERVQQVTRAENGVSSYAVAPDGRSVVFVMNTLGRPDLWRVAVAGGAAARLTQTGESGLGMEFAPDGGRVVYRSGGAIKSLPLSGAAPAAAVVPFSVQMDLDIRAEMTQMFDEAWRKMRDGFYDEQMHGVDWNRIRETYRPIIHDISYKEDFYTLFTLALGELNSSHTGISGSTGGVRGKTTPSVGVELDDRYAGPGVRVKLVMPRGPADREGSRLKPGDYLLKVDGKTITVNEQFYDLLGDKAGKQVELLVNGEPKEEGARTVKLRPISAAAYRQLEYDRWVKEREKRAAELSNGRVHYLHLSAMNDANLEKFKRVVFGEMPEKDALIIDVRFNGGGSIADEMFAILHNKLFSYRTIRGDNTRLPAPLNVFTKPTSVLINEASFSNAEVFPWGYKELKLGKVVGVPTFGGVIGTGSTTLIDGSSLRTPGAGSYTLGGINMENNGCPPDIHVENTPEDLAAGRDRQLETAVAELLKRL